MCLKNRKEFTQFPLEKCCIWSPVFLCLFSCPFSNFKKILGALCNHGFVGPFSTVVPCPAFCLWNKATEALKQVIFILPCSAYDKLLWHQGTATGQCHRITAARKISFIFESLCSHLNRLAFHRENKIQLLSSKKSHIFNWINKR